MDLSGDIVVTIFSADEPGVALLRCENFKRYNRVEVDLRASQSIMKDSNQLGLVIRAGVQQALSKLGLSLPTNVNYATMALAKNGPEGRGGIYSISVFAKPGGLDTAEALKVIRAWVVNDRMAEVDGEVDLSKDELHVYLSTRNPMIRKLREFARRNFNNNGVLVVGAEDKIICQW